MDTQRDNYGNFWCRSIQERFWYIRVEENITDRQDEEYTIRFDS